jgi:hypothetical protein
MNITEAIATEHATFMSIFYQIELVLPSVKSQAEITTMAAVVAGLMREHAQLETDLASVGLDHALLQKDQIETMHRGHHEMADRLHQVQRAGTCGQARRLLRTAIRACVRHFRKEERYVLPMLGRALKPEDQAALRKAFARVRGGKAKPREEQELDG